MMSETAGDPLLQVLLAALPLIARITGGNALVADRAGVKIFTVDHEGREVPTEQGIVHELSRKAAATGQPVFGPSQRHPGAHAWAMPLGDYVLAASNGERTARESQLRASLQAAIPLIAKVAGGEAVIFDQAGRRLMSALSDGTTDPSRLGGVSESSRRAIETGRPNISPSTSVAGAIAVRIPITREFGFGFNNALAVQKEQKLLEEMKRRQPTRYSWDHIVSQSRAMHTALAMARRAAATQSPVWIYGETGTGKELFAQAIHSASLRRDRPFLAINCAALPANLVESNLFGYVEGAFTGARKGGQAGVFEEANGGTLLLDEISEMDLGLQAKLLRVLQEREVCRIGSTRPIPVDVRIICTTNRDLGLMAQQGKFREDLFYRLNVVDIPVPPLRERREDIPSLVEHFLTTCSLRVGRLVVRIEPAAMSQLVAYDWPGNVRELQNCVERAINLVEEDIVLTRHLPPRVVGTAPAITPAALTLDEAIRQAERDVILQTIKDVGGNRARAASRLGISVTTLWRKLREHGYEASDTALPPS